MGRVLLILGLVAFLPATARAEVTVQLGHIKLHLPVPTGYCALDINRVRDSVLFDFEQKSLADRGRLLTVAADCAELEDYRQHDRPIQRIVNFTAALKVDALVRRPEADRAKFIDEVVRDAGTLGPKDVAGFNTRWWNSFDGNAEIQLFDAAERDENAAYLRMVRVAGTRQKISVASAWAVTAVGGYEISINFYERGDESTLPGLVAAAKHEAAQLVAANPPVAVVPPPPAATDQPVDAAGTPLPSLGSLFAGQSTATLAMIAGGVLLVALMLVRALNRPGTAKRKPAEQ
jgi:hypothetical protein